MSVEKIIRTNVERSPFTQISNKVINEIENMEAFTVWVYLYSKSEDWQVIKEHIKKRFKIGDGKLKKILAYLNAHNLIEYRRNRFEDGTLGDVEIWILNGERWSKKESKNNKIKIITTGSKTTRVENQSNGSGALLKKELYQKKEKEHNKEDVVVFSLDQNQEPEKPNIEDNPDEDLELAETEESLQVEDFMNKMFRGIENNVIN